MSKIILMTGGSSGIGFATGIFLIQRGHRVFATTRNLSSMKDIKTILRSIDIDRYSLPIKLERHLEKYLEKIEFIEMNVDSDSSVFKGVQSVLQKTRNKIDVLINNAGFGIFGPVEEIDLKQVKNQFETNVFGYLRTIKAVLPTMRYHKGGKIINISSLAGEIAIPFQSHYSATKFAIEAFTEALKMELRPWNIMVCCVQPGDVNTSFNKNTFRYHYGIQSKEERLVNIDVMIDKMPLNQHSPYFMRAQRCWKAIIKSLPKSANPFFVGHRIASLVDKKHLRTRYSAGLFRQIVPVKILKHFLPNRLSQILFEINYDIFKINKI